MSGDALFHAKGSAFIFHEGVTVTFATMSRDMNPAGFCGCRSIGTAAIAKWWGAILQKPESPVVISKLDRGHRDL
jgi:hypothetical protein